MDLFVVRKKHLNWKFTEPKYETEIETEFWKVNLYMQTGISDWCFWNVDLTKMRSLPSFLIDKWVNSQKEYIKLT